ncbi:hypothetical protein Hypma_011926 [Hypsizygus marmoreus]|uniref:Uncharacterized protein n=1 Tax=Hypsizygus marmoreus TaxID=39966 RepID=A0A369JH75_HYPMA|nr:hypothetical protein Hypma_011926 [Hypsizygus marmoreus]
MNPKPACTLSATQLILPDPCTRVDWLTDPNPATSIPHPGSPILAPPPISTESNHFQIGAPSRPYPQIFADFLIRGFPRTLLRAANPCICTLGCESSCSNTCRYRIDQWMGRATMASSPTTISAGRLNECIQDRGFKTRHLFSDTPARQYCHTPGKHTPPQKRCPKGTLEH